MPDLEPREENDFAADARKERSGLLGEFVDFLRENKKWWLAPIIVSVLKSAGMPGPEASISFWGPG